MFEIEFDHEKKIQIPDNAKSLLQISLDNQIPLIHACGGNARCSTCRVAVLEGLKNLGARSPAEQELANRRLFPAHIRLACQARPTGSVKIRRLVIDDQDIEEIKSTSESGTGREMSLAILFSDIRNFTPFTESNLPYDVVHLLNRYFNRMGQVILNNQGYIDKYMGDGMMALFGLEGGTPAGICKSAVQAALDMQVALHEVNKYARAHLEHELKIGIGIHFGSVIAGEMGHMQKRQFTALGDNVNMAARIESITKKARVGVLISDSILVNIKSDFQKGRSFKTKLKGKSGHYRLHEILGPDQTLHQPVGLMQGSAISIKPIAAPVSPINSKSSKQILLQMVISNKQEIATRTLAFRLQSLEKSLQFKAGQWVELSLPDLNETHIFSIASAPRDGHSILLATRMRQSNFKKKLQDLTSGTAVSISQPDGNFLIPEGSQPLIFLAGGIGITPIRAMLEEILPTYQSSLYLFYSNRTRKETSFLANFELWQKQYPEFHLFPTLTADPVVQNWSGQMGRLNSNMLQQLAPEWQTAHYMLAGPDRFVQAMLGLMSEMKIPINQIHTESFSGY